MLSLRQLLVVTIGSLACGLVALAVIVVEDAGSRRIEEEIGRSLAQLADQMQDKVDRFLFERLQQIRLSASYIGPLVERNELVQAKALIDNLKTFHPDFSWIGLVGRDGRTLVASGPNISEVSRRWLDAGLREPFVEQVHTPSLAERLLFARSRKGTKFIDIAAPVTDSTGKVVAVLSGKLNLSWASEASDALFGLKPTVKTDVLVMTQLGRVIIGPPGVVLEKIPIHQIRKITASSTPFSRMTWPSGRDYVVGAARTDGYRNFKGLRWIILVRQASDEALAPVRHLRRTVLALGVGLAGLGALAAWFLSSRISHPMIDLAKAAEGVRTGSVATIPYIQTFREAAVLSASLASLVRALESRRAAIEEINKTLESQVRDRTKELEVRNTALVAAREDAIRATKAKSHFIAAASHDLRQPLHAMSLLARALSRRITTGESAELVYQLETSLQALRRMFDSLLDITRLDSGLIQPRAETLSLKELIKRVANDSRVDASARGLSFRTHARNLAVTTDAVIIETMLRNLVANALKFTSHGGILLVGRKRGNRSVLEIYDTGPGIPADRQEQIFTEFDRAREHATGANEGLGLGLSIVKRYGDLLGIDIAVCSRMGHGTRFSMLLPPEVGPETRAHEASAQRNASQARDSDLSGLRVLLVDDDAAITAALRQDLEDQGCSVSIVSAPEHLDSQLNKIDEFDAAVVDYNLWHGTTGLDLLSMLESSSGRHIAALIISGATDPHTLDRLLSSGRPWLTKPVDSEAIGPKLVELCGRREQSSKAAQS